MEDSPQPRNSSFWKFEQPAFCSEFIYKSENTCPDFTDCIENTIPGLKIKAQKSKNGKLSGRNDRKTIYEVGCSDGHIPGTRNTDDVSIQCKCNDENGCFWEPSVINFQCFPYGTCKNIRRLDWSEISQDSKIYQSDIGDGIHKWLALPIDDVFKNGTVIVQIKEKLRPEDVKFVGWNMQLLSEFCDKESTVLQFTTDSENALLQIKYKISSVTLEDLLPARIGKLDKIDEKLGDCVFSLIPL
ncbi:unnamed protein product [Oikopleura dioica]|uniref:Uncharacterized protein n=1 Tax=Oikopleura dioica TaxID=34765 RepID=E4XQT3_OIKDI|nr:unnamed protein product [Oikopleura dioica]